MCKTSHRINTFCHTAQLVHVTTAARSSLCIWVRKSIDRVTQPLTICSLLWLNARGDYQQTKNNRYACNTKKNKTLLYTRSLSQETQTHTRLYLLASSATSQPEGRGHVTACSRNGTSPLITVIRESYPCSGWMKEWDWWRSPLGGLYITQQVDYSGMLPH